MFTEELLANIIRFYGHAMQGFMGSYLEKNIQAFVEMQARLAEQAKGLSPEMLTKYMSLESPMLQSMMGNYAEQSRGVFEQMQKQAEQMFGAFGIKR